MQRREIWNYFTKPNLRYAVRTAALLTLAATCGVSPARAQFSSTIGRATISGSVFLEGETQPVSSVRIAVKSLTGGEIATTYTDAGGRFNVAGPNTEGYVVTISEPGYEPVERRVDRTGAIAELVLVLKRTKTTFLPSHSGTVSVHELSVPGKARRAYEKGMESLSKRDPEASLAHFKEATDAFPNYYEAFYQIGLVNMELRRGTDAEQALQRAIDLSGGNYAEPQFALGALLSEREAWSDAERLLRHAIDVDPNSWKGYLFLGQALFGQNRLDEAQKNAGEALLRNSNATSAYILLANTHIRRHEYVLAMNELDRYLALKPSGVTADQARDVRAAAHRVVSRFQRILMPPQFIY
jgi:Tfp pilus assembly protein PilF